MRAWKSVGRSPVYLEAARGARVFDADGHEYIDVVLAYGPLILGHGHAAVKEALHAATETGTCSSQGVAVMTRSRSSRSHMRR